MTYSNDEKPSVLSAPLWSTTNFLWDSSSFNYVEYPWQYTISNIYTNDNEPS